MKLQRDWITPLTFGSFGLLAVTGVLMFFHADSGLNKVAHEWFSWILLASVALHLTLNFAGLRRHVAGWRGRWVLAGSALLLMLSFVPGGDAGKPPFAASVRALAQAPLPTLAQVARTTPQQMRARLVSAGLEPSADDDTVARLTGPDPRRQARVLAAVLEPQGDSTAAGQREQGRPKNDGSP